MSGTNQGTVDVRRSLRRLCLRFERICPAGLTSAAPQTTTAVSRSLRSTHFNSASNAGHSDCPHSVRLYSTFGGTW
jgi:hypothetical protein